MEVSRKFFPEITLDNEELYFAHLEGIISSVDEYAALEIAKYPESINFRLIPSLPKYTNLLIQEIIQLNNLFQIHLDMGKSIKNSGVVTFKINYNGKE